MTMPTTTPAAPSAVAESARAKPGVAEAVAALEGELGAVPGLAGKRLHEVLGQIPGNGKPERPGIEPAQPFMMSVDNISSREMNVLQSFLFLCILIL